MNAEKRNTSITEMLVKRHSPEKQTLYTLLQRKINVCVDETSRTFNTDVVIL